MPTQKEAEKVIAAYEKQFGDVPTLIGLNPRQFAKAIYLLEEAVTYNAAYTSDAEFYEALGMDPLPEGAIV